MVRLFVAIEIPQQIKDDLTRFTKEVPCARWVPAEQNHLTLRFIGEVEPKDLAAIRQALGKLRFPRFPLELCGVGHFPPGHRPPRVLWIGVAESRVLLELQKEVELSLLEVGIPPDERPFSPHLTLARLNEPHRYMAAVAQFEQRHLALSYPAFEVVEVVLFSSVLTRDGAIHRKELVVPCS